jgi:hypothetical protein
LGTLRFVVGEDFETAANLGHAWVVAWIAGPRNPVQGGGQLDQTAANAEKFTIQNFMTGRWSGHDDLLAADFIA